MSQRLQQFEKNVEEHQRLMSCKENHISINCAFDARVLIHWLKALDERLGWQFLGGNKMTNQILCEIYEIRQQILVEHKDDLTDYFRSELANAKAAGHPVAQLKLRRVRRSVSPLPVELTPENESPQPSER